MTTKRVQNSEPRGIVLPIDAPDRSPMAAAEDIGVGYHESYDSKTLFYDCFHTVQENHLEVLGPPLLNLRQSINGISSGGLQAEISEIPRHNLSRLRIDLPEGHAEENMLTVDLEPFGCRSILVHSRETAFDDRRVLLTLFRYEPVAWVIDWVHYHVAIHGVDAVLIYANFVDHTVMQDLSQRLEDISGLIHFAVVPWNYPYGPSGNEAFKIPVPPSTYFSRSESRFCQVGMFEHARLRFLGRARAVLNMDVDELAVTDSKSSVFDLLEMSETPVLILREKRIGGNLKELSIPLEMRRHRHFSRLVTYEYKPSSKWVLAPSRLEKEAQWVTHGVYGSNTAQCGSDDAWYAHFWPLNMGWKNANRSRTATKEDEPKSFPIRDAFACVGWEVT